MAPEFLCYRPANTLLQTGIITEAEYYHNVFQHLVWEHDCKGKAPLANDLIGAEIKSLITKSWSTIDDTTPFEQVFPASRQGPEVFRESLEGVPESFREPWFRSVAYIALRERDAVKLGWAVEGCQGKFDEKFEWEAYTVRQSREKEEIAKRCWDVLMEKGFEEPTHWKGRNSTRVRDDPMY
ncbi:hypothetical protein E8E13_006367 [Curvularia kusanoi]|uniref:Uncharacterized protein n=1 Tax=Curvularia kusanoi TaxID=90978 RepID=A0A9P4T865_CURKU|nr:hypothetical protein E8E13_006367 [Curvularia kusanoi]